MSEIRIGIIGVGNCASSLVQGIEYYRHKEPADAVGLMHWQIGDYAPYDVCVGLAFDVDTRKVGLPVNEAIFQKPNCTTVFQETMPSSSVIVQMGYLADGCASHMNLGDERTFDVSTASEPTKEEVLRLIRESEIDILLNYLPVGSQKASEFYADCALESGVAFINNIPVFIASDPHWVSKFEQRNIPIIGDDIKAQLGATITHRVLMDLCRKRGVKIDRSYQLNVAGNTDFLNMLDRTRLSSKKVSKTDAVQSIACVAEPELNLHIGPSDYIPWQMDNKVCFLRIEGRLFGDVPMNLELRLSVEDSPNSAGIAIDAIRCCKLAIDQGVGGVLRAPSAYFCKHPICQYTDSEAYAAVEEYIQAMSRV